MSREVAGPEAGGGGDGGIRRELVLFARRMLDDGLVEGMSGNLSVRSGEMIWITPSGVPYPGMEPADICQVPIAGPGGDSTRPAAPAGEAGEPGHQPSTETPMHLSVYRATAAAAIVHTHSLFVVAASAVLDVLPAVHYAMADLGGPVRVAPYARFGTRQLAETAVENLAGRAAVILRNHGAIAYGATLAQAYERARTLEWLARAYWHARMLGDPATLSAGALTEVSEAMRALRYGERP